jgi:hypothetical protein
MQTRASSIARAMLTLLAATAAAELRAEAFIDVGLNYSRVETDIAALFTVSDTYSGWHVGAGVRRELTSGSIGARLELDDVDGNLLLAVRALDYRHHLNERLAVTAFVGAARLDVATPAYGYYLGGGLEIKELLPRWSLGIDLRIGDKIARDNLLPSDAQTGRPDNFYDLRGLSLYLSRGF